MRQLKRLGFVIPLLFLLAVSAALAANNPGHDSLYVLKLGDNVTGNINLTGNLTATLVQATGRFFGPNIDIRGDGSSTANANQIIGTATNLEISSSGNLILNKAVTGGMVYVGWPGTTTALNVTGSIYEGGKRVCLADGTNCPVLGGSSSAGGWTNTTTTTSTALDVNVDSGTLFVNSSSNKVGIGTTTPNATLEIGGSFANGDEYLTLNDGGTDRLAIRKYTNTFVEFYSPSAFYFYAPGAIYKGTGSMSFQLEGGATSTHTFQTWNGNLELKTTGGSGEGFIAFSPKSTEAMRIVNGSRVGINTTAPSGALEVAGALNATSIKVGTVSVCLEDGTNCPASSVAYQSSAAGWTNDSTTTRTALQTIVNSSSSAGSFIVQNQTGSQHLFVDGATGRVGIGTNTLTQRLTVAGGANFTAAGASLVIGNGAEIQLLDMGGYGRIYTVAGNIQSSTSLSMEALNGDYTMTGQYGDVLISAQGRNAAGKGDIAFAASASAYDDTNIVLFLSGSNSRVGISTTAPTQKLDVNGSINVSGTGGTIYVGDSRVCLANGTNCPASSVAYQSSAAGWTNDSATTRTALQTIVNSSSSTGSLIVQNTAGKAHLFINGSSGYAGIGTPSPQTVLMVNGSGTVPTGWPSFSYGQLLIGSQRYDTGPINYTTYLSMGADPTVQTGFIAAINEAWISDSPSYNGGKLALQPTGGGTYTGGALAVGSKSTSTAMLYVNSTVFFPISLLVQNQTGSTHLFVNGTTGFVGVGASSPIASGSIFQVNGVSVFQSGSGGIPAYFYGNGGTSYMQVAVSTTGTGFTSFQPGADYLSFTTTAADFRVSTGSGTPAERLRVTGSGLVGIGTTGPTQKLDVNGSVSINGNIAMPTNFSVGNSAAALGTYAVAIGRSASASNTSTVAIGNGALASGTESVAIGPSADARINTAVALGRVALANGSGAVAIGDSATAFDTAGIAIGGYTRAGGHSLAMTTGATAEGGRGIALGYYSSASHLGSVALGTAATTTDQNQFMVGNYSYQLNTIIHGTLNTTGNLYENNNRVCTAANGLCAGSVSYQSSAAGWTNDSTTTSTTLHMNVDSGTLYVNSSSNRVGINTQSPAQTLDINGNINVNGTFSFGTPNMIFGTTASHSCDAGYGCIAMGGYAHSANVIAVAVGYNSLANDSSAAYGPFAKATNSLSVAVGGYSSASRYGMALGANSNASDEYAIALGYGALARHWSSVAIGYNAKTTSDNQLMIGNSSYPLNTQIVGSLNTSGTITQNSIAVCLANGTNCPASSIPYQSSAAGWTNDSTTTRTQLKTLINSSSATGSFIVQNTDGTVHMLVNGSNGYIGFGTAAPQGMYEFTGGTDRHLGIEPYWASTSGMAISSYNTGRSGYVPMALNAQRFIFGFGYVGIGTTGPAQALDVNGSIAVVGTTRISSAGVGTFASGTTVNGQNVCLADGTNCPASSVAYQSSAAGWTNTSTNTSTALNVSITGNVTIGSGMSNQSLLFLRATPGVGSEVFNFGNAQMWNQYVLRDRSYTSMMYGIRTGALNIGQSGADATLSWTNNNNNALNLANNVTLQSLYDLILGAGATERMRIKGANIGINTTNPQNTLEVAGTLNASSIKVGTTNVCLSDGTNCPASSTPYQSSAAGWTNDSTTTRTALQTIVNSSSTTGSLIVQNSTGSMHLFVNGSSGLVGLGTTAPAATLDVNGAAVIKSPNAGYQSSMLYIEATGGTSNTYYQIRTESQIGTNFVVTNAGNTGIGTTAPTQKLDVNGSVNITGNITMPSNFWIGKGASATADGAVAIGSNAAATGTNAVVIGAGATAPNRGVAIGSSATATTGWSTAIGNIVSAGTYSVAVGNLANASANDAIAIGMNAQAYSFGTAVGDSAQATASSAAAYGYGASASGAYAAALGASANAVGNYSIATGYMASAPHNYSVAIGANAATTGTNQLVIGSTGQNLNTQVFGILNTTGNLYENNQRVCTAANGLCAGSVSYQSSAAGWTNTSTTTNTTLGVMINTNYAGPYLTVKNSTHNLLIVSAGGLEVNGPLFTIYPDTYSPKGVRAGDIAIGPYSGWGSQSNEILTYGGNIVMQYTTRGNVGIGTNTPTAALHISSSLANGSLHIQNSTGSSHLLVNGSSGNVGIGTTAPTQKLDVNGTVMSRGLHSPTLIANVTGLPYGVDMAVAGRYVYIDSHLSPYNLTIIDVGVPGQPQILSRTSIAQGGRAIAVAGKHAYIGGANVTVVDVSNPTRPVVVGTVSAGACRGLAVAGPYVHCADWLGGFRIFDVTNTSRPVLAKYLGDSAQTQGIAVYGSYAYVGQMTGAASDALFIYNITNPYAATQVANITISGNLAGVAAQDGVVAVISYTASTLVLVNVTNPASPTILKTLALGATPYKVTMSGQYAYVGTASGIKVVDVSDPANAYIQTSIGGGNYERAIAAGQYLYAAGDTFLTYNTGGVVTPGLQASNAEIGQLQVRGDTTVKGALQAGSIIAGAGGMHVQGGDLSVSGNVNVTGTITAGGSIVCTAGNGACAGTGSSSAGGWTNTTTQTSTALNVNVTTGNVTIGNWKISVNETAMKFYVNDTLVQILESDGTLRIKGTIITNDTLA